MQRSESVFICVLPWFTAALLLVAATSVVAQQPAFRATTRVVEISVVVTDRDGKPVRGLTRDDFSVTENGAAQAISFFESLDGAPSAPTREPFGFGDKPTAYTNDVPPSPGGATVFLLDRLNASFESRYYARKHLEAFIKKMPAGRRVAIYALDGSLRVLHDFSANRESLIRSVDLYEARLSGDYDASMAPPDPDPAMAAWLVDPSTHMATFFTQRRWRATFDAIEALAQHLAGVPGRKNVIWISEVFPMPMGEGRPEFMERMRRATRLTGDAQVSLYAVDSRGLLPAHTVNASGAVSFTTLARVRGNMETMEFMTEETGGRTFGNTNGLDLSMGRALEQAGVSYVLGYYPSSPRADGTFRRLAVRVNRRNATVWHRRGYTATGAPPRDARVRDGGIRSALEAPLQASAIKVAANVEPSAAGGDLTLTVRIDASSLTLERDGERWKGAVDLVLAEVNASGTGKVTSSRAISIDWSDDERSSAVRQGIELSQRVVPQKTTRQLRIVARDVVSGDVGSLLVPVTRRP